MPEDHNLETTIKSHPVVVYGSALFIGFASAVAALQTGMSLFGRTLVSTDEVTRNEQIRAGLSERLGQLEREVSMARAGTQGSAQQAVRVIELERQTQVLESENLRLQLEIKTAREKMESTKLAEVASPDTPVQDRPAVVRSPITSQTTSLVPTQTRKSLELIAGTPAVIENTLTVTLNYTSSSGGQFVVNGQKRSYQEIGERIDVSKAVGRSCFLEVMALSLGTASPNSAKLDYVCVVNG